MSNPIINSLIPPTIAQELKRLGVDQKLKPGDLFYFEDKAYFFVKWCKDYFLECVHLDEMYYDENLIEKTHDENCPSKQLIKTFTSCQLDQMLPFTIEFQGQGYVKSQVNEKIFGYFKQQETEFKPLILGKSDTSEVEAKAMLLVGCYKMNIEF